MVGRSGHLEHLPRSVVFGRPGELLLVDDAAGKKSGWLSAGHGEISQRSGRKESGCRPCDAGKPPAFISLSARVRSHQLRTGNLAVPYAAVDVAGRRRGWRKNATEAGRGGRALRAVLAESPGALSRKIHQHSRVTRGFCGGSSPFLTI